MRKKNYSTRAANALVEFVLTIPLFFLLMWSLVDVARLEIGQILFRKKGYELARHLANSPLADGATLQEEGLKWAARRSWALSNLTVTLSPVPLSQKVPPGRTPKKIDQLTVEIDAPFTPISPILLAFQKVDPFHRHAVIREVHVYGPSQ